MPPKLSNRIMPLDLPKQVTRWSEKETMLRSQYGKVSNLVWSQLESTRMNEASEGGLTNWVAVIDQWVCITRDRPVVINAHGGQVV
jgi:hypothetical protein